MKQVSAVKYFSAILLFIWASLSYGCGGGSTVEYLEAGPGAMIVRHHRFLYRIGGTDKAGKPVSSVQAAIIDDDGAAGLWFNVISLPEPISHGSVLAAANFVYVMGGIRSDGTLSSRIYYAYVNPDNGIPGFTDDPRWEINSRPLPRGIAKAAAALYDGHVYLAGGITDEGESDAVIYARLYRDGHPGYWYDALYPLPSPRAAASATVDLRGATPRLAVAGGESSGQPLNSISWFDILEYGILSQPANSLLPRALSSPVLVYNDGSLLLAGGTTADNVSDAVYKLNSQVWHTIPDLKIRAMGPGSGRAAGNLFYLDRPGLSGVVTLSVTSELQLEPEAPQVLPRSGLAIAGSYVRVRSEPGTILRHRTSVGGTVDDVTETDSVWSPGLRVTADMEVAFRAFGKDGRPSPLTRRKYRVRSTGMFVHTEKLTVTSDPLYPAELVNPGWFFIDTLSAGKLTISWKDSESAHPVDETTAVRLSLFEPDLYTTVPDISSGQPLSEMLSAVSPAVARVSPGRYYIYAQDIYPADTPGSFSIKLLLESDE